MMTIEQLLDNFTNENGFQYGVDTVMKSLRPNCMYTVESKGGTFEVVEWYENQWSDETQSYIEPPTSQEIRDEYIRQRTVEECLEYFRRK